MTLKKFLFYSALFLASVADAQYKCWPECGSNHEITLAFRMRRPTMTLSGTEACRAEVRELIASFDREDQNLTNFSRLACAAFSGWVEIDPGSCGLGGPLCCTAKPSHWTRDGNAWSRFKAEQSKIGNQRRAQVEAFLKRCSGSTKNTGSQSQQAGTAANSTAGTTNANSTQQKLPAAANSSFISKPQPGFSSFSSSNQDLKSSLPVQVAPQNAYLEEIARKDAEKQRLQEQIDQKATTNLALQQLNNDLNQITNKRMVENFGKDVKKNGTGFVTNPLVSTNSSSNSKSSQEDIKEISKNSSSLDDFSLEESQTTIQITAAQEVPKDYGIVKIDRQSPEWKNMYEEAYKKFLEDAKKDPELMKKGSRLDKMPNGEYILFETPEAIKKRKRLPVFRSRTAVIGKRG